LRSRDRRPIRRAYIGGNDGNAQRDRAASGIGEPGVGLMRGGSRPVGNGGGLRWNFVNRFWTSEGVLVNIRRLGL